MSNFWGSLQGESIFYVFMKLVRNNMLEYYLCPSEYVAENIYNDYVEWLKIFAMNGQKTQRNQFDRI